MTRQPLRGRLYLALSDALAFLRLHRASAWALLRAAELWEHGEGERRGEGRAF